MTTHSPPPPPPVRRWTLLDLLADAKAKLDLAQAEYDALAERARKELPMGTHRKNDVMVQITANRRWDKDKAVENYGEEICSLQCDQVRAKAVMTGAAYDSFYVEGPPRVVVKKVHND